MLREELRGRDWLIANDSPLGVLCVMPPSEFGNARAIADYILAAGCAWVAAAKFEGRDVIRICVTHGETTAEDAVQLISALEAARIATAQ